MNRLVEKIAKSGRQKLTLKQTFFHYFFAFFMPLTIIGLCFLVLKIVKTDEQTKVYIQSHVNTYALYAGLAYFVRQYASLSMSFVEFAGTKQEFENRVNKLVSKYNWVIESKADHIFVCTVPFKWSNWGTLMTIVKTDDGVYFNSICDLYNRPSTTSFGLNRKNLKRIRQAFE